MSSALVRKALELLESEPDKSTHDSKKSRKNDSRKDLKVRKKKREGHSSRVLGDVKSRAALQVELARRLTSCEKDRTNDNLKTLLALGSQKPVDFNKAQKIFDQTVKSKRPIDDSAPKSKSSVFSEEDFEKFEEELFVS